MHKYNRCFEVFVFPRCLSRRATLVERGARLRERRVSHGITQQQVGEALCVPVEGSVPYSITLVVYMRLMYCTPWSLLNRHRFNSD